MFQLVTATSVVVYDARVVVKSRQSRLSLARAQSTPSVLILDDVVAGARSDGVQRMTREIIRRRGSQTFRMYVM